MGPAVFVVVTTAFVGYGRLPRLRFGDI